MPYQCRDAAQLWPKPLRCGCNDLAHPACPCPKNCGDKFKPKKTNKRKCQCIPTCPCPHPPALCGDPVPRHMVRLGQTYSENSTLHFLCQPPFNIKGSEFRTCTGKQDKWKTGDGVVDGKVVVHGVVNNHNVSHQVVANQMIWNMESG